MDWEIEQYKWKTALDRQKKSTLHLLTVETKKSFADDPSENDDGIEMQGLVICEAT